MMAITKSQLIGSMLVCLIGVFGLTGCLKEDKALQDQLTKERATVTDLQEKLIAANEALAKSKGKLAELEVKIKAAGEAAQGAISEEALLKAGLEQRRKFKEALIAALPEYMPSFKFGDPPSELRSDFDLILTSADGKKTVLQALPVTVDLQGNWTIPSVDMVKSRLAAIAAGKPEAGDGPKVVDSGNNNTQKPKGESLEDKKKKYGDGVRVVDFGDDKRKKPATGGSGTKPTPEVADKGKKDPPPTEVKKEEDRKVKNREGLLEIRFD